MSEVVLIGGMALVTFVIRYPALALVGHIHLPDPVVRGLRYVPIAVLTAITVPAVVIPQGDAVWVGIRNAHLVAALVAGAVAWRSKSLLLTIVIGMGVFFVWRVVVG